MTDWKTNLPRNIANRYREEENALVLPSLTVQDEGATIGTAGGIATVNFVGAGVTATGAGAGVTVTIPAGATSVTMGGDVTGNSAANTVTQVQGKPFVSTATSVGGLNLLPDAAVTNRSNVFNTGAGLNNTFSISTTTIQMGNCKPTWHVVNMTIVAGAPGNFTECDIATGFLPALNVPQEVQFFYNDSTAFNSNGTLFQSGRAICNANGSFTLNFGTIQNGAEQTLRFNLFDIQSN